MPRQISQKTIVTAVLHGIERAQRFYESCTGDCWLWEGPEYLLCTNIASQLHNMPGAKYITLESNVHGTLKDAKASTLGAPNKKLRTNGRFDVVVWWGNGLPRTVVEIKNNVWSYAQVRKDVDRVCAVLLRKPGVSSIQFGLIAFYTSCKDSRDSKAKKKLEKLSDLLLARAQESTPDSISISMVRGTTHIVKDNAWTSTCFVFKLAK